MSKAGGDVTGTGALLFPGRQIKFDPVGVKFVPI